jgi:hypothetical protein
VPLSQNDHLYYRLRSSYGDNRELNLAPGHLFLGFEGSDLATFLDLAIQFGWGVHPPGIAPGIWTINGVRAHEVETDHTGIFFPVSATISVSQ